MNRSLTIAVAAALVTLAGGASAGTALAGDITIETTPFVSSRAPEEVRSELTAFKKSGINPWSRGYNPLAAAVFKSEKAPAQLKAEYIAHRDEVAALNGEDGGSMYLADLAAAKRRAATMANAALSSQQ
ncbi:MAG TPA: hypothetical protein VHL79_01955 [Ramlibacter sp.]|jgi:hypothetical protein|nr:hypothetical protein [Ramlibacter sp.]